MKIKTSGILRLAVLVSACLASSAVVSAGLIEEAIDRAEETGAPILVLGSSES